MHADRPLDPDPPQLRKYPRRCPPTHPRDCRVTAPAPYARRACPTGSSEGASLCRLACSARSNESRSSQCRRHEQSPSGPRDAWCSAAPSTHAVRASTTSRPSKRAGRSASGQRIRWPQLRPLTDRGMNSSYATLGEEWSRFVPQHAYARVLWLMRPPAARGLARVKRRGGWTLDPPNDDNGFRHLRSSRLKWLDQAGLTLGGHSARRSSRRSATTTTASG